MPTPIRLPGGGTVNLDPNPTGSTTSIPSDLPQNHPAGWDPAYGGVPNIPDPIASAWKALGGNMDLLPALFSMGNAYNAFNYDQRLGQVQGTPGYSGIAANLAGQLPQDVVNQLAQRGAERGITSGGASDSPNTNAAYLRALGLTSLDQQKLGQQQQDALLGLYPQAAPFNLMSGLVTSDEMQAALNAANTNAAAPNPRDAALEEQRKLLEAIEAGKRAAGPGGTIPPADLTKILDLLKGMNTTKEPPGTYVANGPNKTVDRGTGYYNPGASTLPPPYVPNRVDPGASGLIQPDRGRPQDVIQNAFNTPDLADAGMLGGAGMDPSLNALLGQGGIWGHLNSKDFANYTGGSNQSAGPWSPATGMVTGGAGAYPGITPEDIAQFGNPFTAGNLTYGNTQAGPFGGTTSGIDQGNYAFSQPITSRNLFTGNQMISPEEIAMMLGLTDESSMITPNDRSQFGNPITLGGLMGGVDTSNELTDTDWANWLFGE